MQLVFTPALGSSTTVAVVPGTVVQFAARVSTRDYNEAVANGTTVELWGDLPRPNAAAGDWAATRFEPAPAAPEHHDAGVPPNVLSLLPADPEPVPTTSAAPETTLLVASFVIPADVTAADYQFTYRLAHSNESSTWHTWLGDAGSNGHLVINQDAAPVEGLVFSAEWSTTDDARESPADGTVANLSGPVDWSGWALDLDPASESPAPPRRFSTLPKALSATHLALFPNPGLTSLNPASHAPVLLSSSRLSLDDRALTAHGSPIRVAPLSRAAVQSSLPEHAVLLPESACTSPFVVVHDTRGAALSILPTTSSPPGTQILSLDLDQAKISADSPAKSLLFSPSANKATFYTPGARVAVPSLGADLLVQETYPLGENGLWEVGVAGATKVNEPAPEPEAKPEPVEPAVSPTKVAPPPIQTSRPTTQEFDMPPSPETPAEARIEVTPAKPPRLDTVTEVEPEPEHAVTPRSPTASASFTSTEKKGVLALLKGVAAVVMYYVTRSAWSIFGWGFRMFGVGVHAANQTRPKSPEGAAEEAAALVEGPTPVVKPIARAPAPASTSAPTDESESDSETGSLNEVAPTPIDPTHSAHVGVVSPNSPARRPDVNMPLTPPMSPKTTTTAPFVIPGPVSPPKPKVTFASPAKSTVFVVGPSTDELEVKVGGVRIPTAWDRVSGPGEGCTWVMDVEVGEGRVEVGVA